MTLDVVTNLLECFESFSALASELSEDDWAAPSLCPHWAVRDVATHLTGAERALTGWEPSVEDPPPFGDIAGYAAAAKAWSTVELVDEVRSVLDRRRTELLTMGDDVFARPSWTPVGVQTYGGFMEVRTFDFWVHEQDVRVPLARPGHVGGPAAAVSLEQVRRSLGYIVGKRAGVPDGRSVQITLTGPVEATLAAVVEGRARAVESLDDPDATMTTDFLTFMLLACGRIDPEQPIEDGRVELTGDVALAGQLARNLRFTF